MIRPNNKPHLTKKRTISDFQFKLTMELWDDQKVNHILLKSKPCGLLGLLGLLIRPTPFGCLLYIELLPKKKLILEQIQILENLFLLNRHGGFQFWFLEKNITREGIINIFGGSLNLSMTKQLLNFSFAFFRTS